MEKKLVITIFAVLFFVCRSQAITWTEGHHDIYADRLIEWVGSV